MNLSDEACNCFELLCFLKDLTLGKLSIAKSKRKNDLYLHYYANYKYPILAPKLCCQFFVIPIYVNLAIDITCFFHGY